MKNLTKIIALALVLVLTVTALISCGGSIKGKWEYTEEGMTIVWEFKDDTFKMYAKELPDLVSLEGEYEVKGDKLIIDMEGEEAEMKFKVSGDKLTLSGEDGEELVLKKSK